MNDDAEPFANRHAASLRAIYDLSDLEKSLYIHSGGQSGNPLSEHYKALQRSLGEERIHPDARRAQTLEADGRSSGRGAAVQRLAPAGAPHIAGCWRSSAAITISAPEQSTTRCSAPSTAFDAARRRIGRKPRISMDIADGSPGSLRGTRQAPNAQLPRRAAAVLERGQAILRKRSTALGMPTGHRHHVPARRAAQPAAQARACISPRSSPPASPACRTSSTAT